MRDAAMERLSKILSEPSSNGGKNTRSGRQLVEVHLNLAEGWFSLFLLAAVVYSTIWCIQAVGWVQHLGGLTPTTALGLLIGVFAAKQRRFPSLSVHLAVVVFCLLFAFWQTAGAFYQGHLGAFAHGIQSWIMTFVNGGTSDDDSIFLFLILIVGFLLAYTSAWLVYHLRNPWLAIAANAMVLLINLNNADNGFVVFLIVFLVASFLLLLRFNLFEWMRRWQRQGLRYADDIGWDIMQAGALISVGILIFSWLLPAGYINAAAAQIWTVNSNPWVQFQNTWNRMISVNGGVNPSNHGNFRDTLALGGNPNLNHDIVMTVQSDDPNQYLESLSYDIFTGRGWENSSTSNFSLKANQVLNSGAVLTRTIQQTVTIVNPPGEQKAYLLGAPDIVSVSVPADVAGSKTSDVSVAWVNHGGNLASNMKYKATSSVSIADIATLRTVPLPKDAPQAPTSYDTEVPPTVYDSATANAYLQLPKTLDPNVRALAERITKDAPTMYDKAVALETYLRTHYSYSVDIQPPANEQDAVSWFLFRSGNKGFCNYFASAMAIMARAVGIPARVAVGYTNGTLDNKTHAHVIHGTDAHAWTQVYFAGYGWINFEPSASFSAFTRPLPNQYTSGNTPIVGSSPVSSSNSAELNRRLHNRFDGLDSSGSSASTAAQGQVQIRQQVGMALGGFVLLALFACILFGIWWRRLFRGYDLSAQIFGRLCVLANLAGVELRSSQTPYEYLHEVATVRPQDAAVIERLGDIYVRDRWAAPSSAEHPARTGEMRELPSIWSRLRPRLFLHVVRHPRFLLWVPRHAWATLQTLRHHSHRDENELFDHGFVADESDEDDLV